MKHMGFRLLKKGKIQKKWQDGKKKFDLPTFIIEKNRKIENS